MTPAADTIINEVATKHGVDRDLLVRRCRIRKVFRARVEAAQRLSVELKYSTPQIGRLLGHDHTTIVFYLGRLERKPSEPKPPRPPKKRRWKPPQVRHIRWVDKPKHFLKPYAGADMTDYQWIERPSRHEHQSN